jgi:hypothetical protein
VIKNVSQECLVNIGNEKECALVQKEIIELTQ